MTVSRKRLFELVTARGLKLIREHLPIWQSAAANSVRMVFSVKSWRTWLLTAIVIAGFVNGDRMFSANEEDASFYRDTYSTAVSFACGYGYKHVAHENKGAIRDFLVGDEESLDCDEAFGRENAPELVESGILQNQTALSQRLFAILWMIYGFNWGVAGIVAGLLLAALAGAVYFLTRQFLGFWPAIMLMGFTAWGAGPIEDQIVYLRDFSKAPFIVAGIALWIKILFSESGQITRLAALAGAIVACGVGFRSDPTVFLVLIPLSILLHACFHKRSVKHLTALGAFVATSWIIDVVAFDFSKGIGRNNAHFVVLGHSEQFYLNMGAQTPPQAFQTHYHDHVAFSLIGIYEESADRPAPGYGTKEYDKAGQRFLVQMLKEFPANEITMAVAASYTALFGELEDYLPHPALVFLVVATLIFAFFGYKGAALVLLITALAGLSGIQFDPRHYFHISGLGLILLFIAALGGLQWLVGLVSHWIPRIRKFTDRSREFLVPSYSNPRVLLSLTPCVLVAIVLAIIPIARSVQTQNISSIIARINASPSVSLVEVASDETSSEDEQRFVTDGIDRGAYLNIALKRPTECAKMPVLQVEYTTSEIFWDLSYTIAPPPGRVDRILAPLPFEDAEKHGQPQISVFGGIGDCEVTASFVNLTVPTIPFVYFDGFITEPGYLRDDVTNFFYGFSERVEKSRSDKNCVATKRRITGHDQPISYNQEISVPDFIEVSVTPTDDGIGSDHFNLANAAIVIDEEEYFLSDFPFYDHQFQDYPSRRDFNILNKTLQIGDKEFGRGIGTHAPGSYTLRVPNGLRDDTGHIRFVAGIDSQTNGAGSVDFSVCLIG